MSIRRRLALLLCPDLARRDQLSEHQIRDLIIALAKAFMVPMECIQGDYHKFDVFVQWPGIAAPVRPQLTAAARSRWKISRRF